MSLAFVTFGDRSDCCSITVWWYLLSIIFLIIRIIIVFYQPLIDIIFTRIIWADGVLWLHWIRQGWRDTFRRRINNGAHSVNAPPPIYMFSLNVFYEGSTSTAVLVTQIFIALISIICFFNPLPVLLFVCSSTPYCESWVDTLRLNGE